MTITLLLFLTEAVIIHGADWLLLGNPPDEPSPAPSFAWPSHSGTPYLFCKGNWGGEGGRERILLPLRAGTRFHSPLSLRSHPCAWWQEGRGSSASCRAASCCLGLRDGRVRLHQSISLSHSLMLLNLSTPFFSSATRLNRSLTWLHKTHLLSLLSSGTSARLRYSLQPETWTAMCLCKTSLWVPTLLLATTFPQVETIARRSPGRAMSTSWVARKGTAPCPRTAAQTAVLCFPKFPSNFLNLSWEHTQYLSDSYFSFSTGQ